MFRLNKYVRSYSSKVDCYISKSYDVYTNLAIEEFLLKTTAPDRYVLFLWRNKPCVVIGRNQNPFTECNLPYMKQHNIPLVRRRSGGGAVYHDMGNSIYTIYMPKEAFSRKANAELVANALHQLDVPAYVNDRHDITVENHKVSGSAYKITSKRTYHHGTMLIDTDIPTLKQCLSKKIINKIGMVSKGVESVPSPVTNLRNYSYTIDHQQFCEAVMTEFNKKYNGGQDIKPVFLGQTDSQLPLEIIETRHELQSWDWIYGQTPEFVLKRDARFSFGRVHLEITSRSGIITQCQIKTDREDQSIVFAALSVTLEGARYTPEAVMEAKVRMMKDVPELISDENGHIIDELQTWLSSIL